jgi:hypothetical protein
MQDMLARGKPLGVPSPIWRGCRAVAVLAVVLPAGLALRAGTATADPAGPASCIAHEAAGISPPGSFHEFPGGMPAFQDFLSERFPGVPGGQVIREVAQLHEGSHEACDAAIEG